MCAKNKKTGANAGKVTNPMGENQVPQGTIVIRYIEKKDIHDVLEHEKRTGYQFNRMPTDEIIASIGDDELLQVIDAGIHNGVEMRCTALRLDGSTLIIDMPFIKFFGLKSRSWNWRKVQPQPSWTSEYFIAAIKRQASQKA